ncbi:Concanavalin A-like lectin/glucanases superfamily protein [Theileria parva strain Muguga]|uniref:Concanavalin A-like lectin/glucanases superfamily protein n=1 Tax=Theileria parva strain Muguga TaxID=333668 RepID=UPI001C61FD49|nr:Concanavalin A-like lectin/glucanases superfamily protein [Theileria parva strain Muguga]EAN33494.2 Concanavalin A-like lectin/glucanases superfamily protein [Theileria parva strain Muguga]
MFSFKLFFCKLSKCVTLLLLLYSRVSQSSDDIQKLKNDIMVMDSNVHDLARVLDKSLYNSFQISDSVCLGENVMTSGIKAKGLAGYWTFDKLYPVDETGNGNHFYSPVVSGPPSNGHGSSLSFNTETWYRIRATESLDLGQFTITFRVYLLGDYSPNFRNFLSRNYYNPQSPNILFYPYNNKLSVRVFTESGDIEGLSSNSSIPSRRWTQVTIVCTENAVKIYINGMLDNSIGLRGKPTVSSGDLVMGKALRYDGFAGYVDDLRIYNYGMGSHEVAAFVSDCLSGFDNSFRVQLGCTFCGHREANSNGFCPSGFKLCTLDQLYISGAHIARANGWLHSSNQIWYKNIKNTQNESRAALCCS